MGGGLQGMKDKWSDFKDGDEKIFDLHALTGAKVKDRKFVVNDLEGQDEDALKTFKSLNLTAIQIDKFYSVFRAIDGDNGGDIDMHEFYVFFDLSETPFVDRTFQLFDRDDSGKIDFEEFVCAVWNFCSTARDALIPFAFNLYDLDGSKDLDPDEVKLLVAEILGDEGTNDEEQAIGGGDFTDSYKVNVDALMKLLKPSKNGLIDVKAFTKFVMKAPQAMKPAYELQEVLRARVLGEAFWKAAMRKRDKIVREQQEKLDTNINEEPGSTINQFGVSFIAKDVPDGIDKDSVKGKYEELANNEYDAAKFRVEEAARVREKMKLQLALWDAQTEATSGANQDPLDLIAKLDDPAHEGEMKEKIQRDLEQQLYDIRHIKSENEWKPRVERTLGVRVPGGGRRNRLLYSAVEIGKKRQHSHLRRWAEKLEIQEKVETKRKEKEAAEKEAYGISKMLLNQNKAKIRAEEEARKAAMESKTLKMIMGKAKRI